MAFSMNCDFALVKRLAAALADTPLPTWDGWYQISRHHRHVARFPLGKTGSRALTDAWTAERTGPWMSAEQCAAIYWEIAQSVAAMGERSAGDQFLRVYAEGLGLVRWLSQEEFDEFRRAGGGTYA